MNPSFGILFDLFAPFFKAKIEDVIRFKIASEIISRIIENFGYANLFPRESYEFYARITGRTLRFDENDSRLRFITPASKLLYYVISKFGKKWQCFTVKRLSVSSSIYFSESVKSFLI